MMRAFSDESGRDWIATAREEATPRHFGRWYLLLYPADRPDAELPLPEVRWQTRATAERTVATMSTFELLRRLRMALARRPRASGAA
ncbi:MAG: hypothetical protein HY703_10385 [Gemmatimonadetes bacterium]|nr:hypothetical protein [Gemmatimonadota bacterium]